MTQLLAFHNDKKIKAKYLKRIRAHAKADRLIQGTGWENGKGCAVGCTLENYDHSRYPIELGISETLARLEDRIFEGLPKAEAMKWPERFLKAVPVGKDLALCVPKILLWMQIDPKHGVRQYADANGKAAIDLVADVLATWIKTGSPNESAAESARSAAWSARSAAWSARSAAESAWSAAESARSAAWSARSAAWSARSAAWSARSAAESAWSAAESNYYIALSEALLKILGEGLDEL